MVTQPSHDGWPEALAARPVCPRRHLPIPFIAEVGPDGTGHFTILDDDRAQECLAGRLCAMCGAPMGREVALIGDRVSLRPDGYFIEPPVHERCAEIATGGLCPFLSHERVPRRPVPGGVAVVGTERDRLDQVGRTVAKRPVIVAIATEYTAGLVPTDTGAPVPAYWAAGRLIRVRQYEWAGGRLTEVPPPTRAAAPPMARTQPRRLPRSRRHAR